MAERLLQINSADVLKYYNKTEEDVKNDVNALFDWYKKQSHLPKLNYNKQEENIFRNCLMANKFSLEKAKHILEIRYVVRNLMPDFFDNWDVLSPELQNALNTGACVSLPKLTPNLNRITIYKMIDSDPCKYNQLVLSKMALLIAEMRALVEFNVGEHFIFDWTGFTFSHLAQITPALLKKIHILSRKAYSVKLQTVHLINAPPGIDKILSILKLILKPKLYNRIHVHKNLESLHVMIPKELLPMDYGGHEPRFEELWAKWVKEIIGMRSYFIEELKKKADESRKIRDISDNIMGSIQGSFRQLQID